MRLVRYQSEGLTYGGYLEDGRVYSTTPKAIPTYHALDDVQLLAPVLPTKIVAVGLNYRDHAEELSMDVPEEPLLFMKPTSSVIGPGEAIVLPESSDRVDYEAELAVVVGKKAKCVTAENAPAHILGYTCLNDVTARDLQKRDGQWIRAKGFDTFCPIGPWVETDLDPSDLSITLNLNGKTKQASRTSNLIFNPFRLLEFVSRIMTLAPGDIIATGTPSGIGPMNRGDTVEVRIEGLGALENPVRSDSS